MQIELPIRRPSCEASQNQKISRSNQPFTTDQSNKKMAKEIAIGMKMIDQVKLALGVAAAIGVDGGTA